MKTSFALSLFIHILWLFVGGIIAFWIGANDVRWLITGTLIGVIGIVGIQQAFAMRQS